MDKVDIKYLGIPNVCFSLTDKEDNRDSELFSRQRIERGFDDSETWSLRDTIGNFIIPRLKRFRELYEVHIVNRDDMLKKVDLSIRAFELLVRNQGQFDLSTEEGIEYEAGMAAFSEIFIRLWW